MQRDPDESSGTARRRTAAAELTVSCRHCRSLHRPESLLALHPVCASCAHDTRTAEPGTVGFHALSERAVAGVVGETSPGNYALGYLDGSLFTVFYVGRSDSDVGASLKGWVDAPSQPRLHRGSPQTPWRAATGPSAVLGTRALGRTPIGIDTSYTHFTFRYAPSAIEAFERECRDYHELGGSDELDNRDHPMPPEGSPWACPMHG